ncbi:Protein SERAC1, partial [Tolypocladium ophioglossoides CBS 100239]
MGLFRFWKSGRRAADRVKGDGDKSDRRDSGKDKIKKDNEEDLNACMTTFGDLIGETNGLFPLEPVGIAVGTTPPLLDIVAVHGLGGHWQKTWTAENGKLWLRDFLPARLRDINIKAAIWSYGYNADTALSAAVTDLTDEAEMLLDRIKGERDSTEEKARPIVFIAHSLGGILIKKAIIRAQERSDLYGELLSKIHGIIFLGTPHCGSDVAWWASIPANLLRALQLGTGTNTAYLKALTTNSAEFSLISQQWVERSKNLTIRTFYETEMLCGVLVVDKGSARLNLANETAVGLAGSNHRTLCKFESAGSQRYKPVLNAVKQLAGEVRHRAMANADSA